MTVTSLQQIFVRTGESLPASGDFEGQIFVDTKAGQVYRWDGSNWVTVGNSIDKQTITQNTNGDIQSSGIITPSNLSNITTAKADSFDQQITVVNLSLASNEIATIHYAIGTQTTFRPPNGSLDVDGVSAPLLESPDIVDDGGDRFGFIKSPNGIVAENSIKFTVRPGGGERIRGMILYEVRTV